MNVRCPQCNAENRADSHFCRKCGARIPAPSPAVCPVCGAALRSGAHFCQQCGAVLSRAAPSVPSPAMPPVPRLPASPAIAIQPRIGGLPGGQVAIGDYNLLIQMGDVRDAVVNIVAPTAQAQPRATPAALRPRPIPGFLDRQVEVAAATGTLLSASTIAFHGESGIGKTALLCHLAHHPAANAFRDGVLYLHAAHQNGDDLAAALYAALYTSDVAFHPTPAQLRTGLQNRRALVLLDDVTLSRDALEALLHLAPNCTFVITSERRCYWGPGQAFELPGLPPADGATLLARELGRALTPEEHFTAQRLAATVNGHPLRLLQLAALARGANRPLAELLPLAQAPTPQREFPIRAIAALPELERRILATLAAVDAPLDARPLALIVDSTDVQPALQSLLRQGLVQQHSPRYSLTGDLAAQLALLWDLDPWRRRALEVLTQWAEGQTTTPEALYEARAALGNSIEQAIAAQQWREALRLIRAGEGALALGGQWGAWGQWLQHALTAARALQDRPAEAWALHQLGTRAGCLGDKNAAILLTEALNLRQKLGDQAGVAITRHNMNLFLGTLPVSEAPKETAPEAPHPKLKPPSKAAPHFGLALKQLGLMAAAMIGIAIIALGGLQVWSHQGGMRTTPLASPIPRLWLAEGCGSSYVGDTRTQLYLQAYRAGNGIVWLDGREFGRAALDGATSASFTVDFSTIEPGAHTFEATVVVAEDVQDRSNRCAFTVIPPVVTEPPVDGEGPLAPRLLSPKNGERLYCPLGAEEYPFELTWSAVSDPSGIAYYEIVIAAPEYTPEIYANARTESPQLLQTLPCRGPIRWHVRAFDDAGNPGAWSDTGEFFLRPEEDVAPPPTPEPISPGDPNPEYRESVGCPVTLRWNPVYDPSGVWYMVEVEALYESDNVRVVAERNLSDTQLVLDDDCDPYTSYRWRVSARDGAGNESGEWSPWLYYTVFPY